MFTLFSNVIQMIISQFATFILGIPALFTLAGITEPGFRPLEMQAMSIKCNIQNLDDPAMKSPKTGQCMVDEFNAAYLRHDPKGTKRLNLTTLSNLTAACAGPLPRPNCMVDSINNYFWGVGPGLF